VTIEKGREKLEQGKINLEEKIVKFHENYISGTNFTKE
jgi:hypothetical protein